jgi:hypothetical protein
MAYSPYIFTQLSVGASLYCPFATTVAQLAYREGSMGFPVAVIQTLSAFTIFVAGYLVLLIMIICLLVVASCIYKGGRLLKAYTVRPACGGRDWPLAEKGLH